MPEMAAVCPSSSGTPPAVYGGRGPQGIGPPHGYYNHCNYPSTSPHVQYNTEAYSPYQGSQNEQQHHLHAQHLQQQHQQQQQQSWGYGPGVGMMNGRSSHGALGDEWSQGYMLPGGSSTPNQNHYNYQYRNMNSHTTLDYGSPLPSVPEPNHQALEGSPSPDVPLSPDEPSVNGMGTANNQGAKSLRAPYEWMKPSTGLPQTGKTRTKDKYRVVYSDHQRLELEKEFHFSKYITIRRKAEIAGQLGLSERQVKIWFQNRRAKERKQNKKRQEQSGELSAGGGNSVIQEQHHQMHQGSNHDLHNHHHQLPIMPFPKTEKEDDFSVKHELPCQALPPLAPSTPHAQQLALHHHHHHHQNSSSLMTLQPAMMSRATGHQALPRYHDGVAHRSSCVSPTSSGEELSYRLNNGADSAGNSVNLSGSSDSGVLSSH